jgi:hypothetical protein
VLVRMEGGLHCREKSDILKTEKGLKARSS